MVNCGYEYLNRKKEDANYHLCKDQPEQFTDSWQRITLCGHGDIFKSVLLRFIAEHCEAVVGEYVSMIDFLDRINNYASNLQGFSDITFYQTTLRANMKYVPKDDGVQIGLSRPTINGQRVWIVNNMAWKLT